MAMQFPAGPRAFVNSVTASPHTVCEFQSVAMPPLAQLALPVAKDTEAPKKQKLPPHVQDQFRKTRICNFFQQGRCTWGTSCRFAHHEDELSTAPDLTKTKLCFNFFRRRCNDANCSFAHGHQELRATTGVYKTELAAGMKQASARQAALVVMHMVWPNCAHQLLQMPWEACLKKILQREMLLPQAKSGQ